VPTKTTTKLKCVKLSNNGLNNYTIMNSKLCLTLIAWLVDRKRKGPTTLQAYKIKMSMVSSRDNHQSSIINWRQLTMAIYSWALNQVW